jgi:acetyl-CoA C-acetyltransferase
VLGYAAGGCAPEWVMMAPEKSINALATKMGKKPRDYDLHEINEAFSVAAIALQRVLDLDPEARQRQRRRRRARPSDRRVGRRVLTTLLHAMQQRRREDGMASLCLGGGNAVSLAVERL